MEKGKSSNRGQPPKKATKKGLSKGPRTRQRILDAARRVFARHPYHAASIRMIASEAGMEHGAIRYHFARKSEIFEEIVQVECEKLYQNYRKWAKETIGLRPEEGLSLLLDLALEWHFSDPEPLHLINQNISQMDNPENIPGYDHLINILIRTREPARKVFPAEVDSRGIERFNDTFNALIINYVGASSLQAGALGIDPDSSEYRAWVKDTLMFIMVPVMNKMLEKASS